MSYPQPKSSLRSFSSLKVNHNDNEIDIKEYLDSSANKHTNRDYSEFILCVTRVWSQIAHLNMKATEDNQLHKALNIWTQKFCTLGGKEAATYWDSFLSCLVKNVRQPFLLGCASCGRVSEHEKILLKILHNIQIHDFEAARRDLSKLMWDVEIPIALHFLIKFEAILHEEKASIDINILHALDDKNYTSKKLMH